jgi:hypothetical protein
MQVLVRDHHAMIAASVQCNVYGILKRPHPESVPRSRLDWKFLPWVDPIRRMCMDLTDQR